MPRPCESVLLLHNLPRQVSSDGEAFSVHESDAGVLEEVRAVVAAMETLGVPHRVRPLRELAELPELLSRADEPIVFNLVEELPGRAMDASLAPAICEAYGKGCTGNDTQSLLQALDKVRSKAILAEAGLPVPAGIAVVPGEPIDASALPPGPWLVKPAASDASEGIDARRSIVRAGGPALEEAVNRIHRQFGQTAIVEQLVGQRELNVSVIQGPEGATVLPLAEIDFSAFGTERPRIVDYAAKWLADSFEFNHTPRIIPAPLEESDAQLVRRTALQAWSALGCRDYARVDFRMDDEGRLFVLEVNPNPDIAPDAGFAAALAAAGVPYHQFVSSTIESAADRAIRPKAAVNLDDPSVPIRHTESRDRADILELLEATAFFRPDELEIAREVLDEAIAKGPRGHYQSFTAEQDGRAIGWVCYGPTPCTLGTYDIYWIAVSPRTQARGVGTRLMAFAEDRIRQAGGRLAVVETSGRPSYRPTRRFYLTRGYRQAARLPDFYATGDDKVVYTRAV
ncbi:MAG: GNAT family N-acetyltransferase [Phycisphaerae bacterium]|nr:GNAT family N-acetyltransferase [Phycisphaerae bacterium]